jgi:hypothetical protein
MRDDLTPAFSSRVSVGDANAHGHHATGGYDTVTHMSDSSKS